jgi:hypothetical protein
MPYRQFSERKSVHRYGGETRDGLGFIGVQDSENIGEQGRDDSDRHYLVHFCQNGRPAKDKSSRLGTHDGGSGLGRPIGLVRAVLTSGPEFFLFTGNRRLHERFHFIDECDGYRVIQTKVWDMLARMGRIRQLAQPSRLKQARRSPFARLRN